MGEGGKIEVQYLIDVFSASLNPSLQGWEILIPVSLKSTKLDLKPVFTGSHAGADGLLFAFFPIFFILLSFNYPVCGRNRAKSVPVRIDPLTC